MRSVVRGVWWGGVVAIGAGLVLEACRPSAKSSSQQSTPGSDTAVLIFEGPLRGWGLVGVPRAGGPAVYRALPDLNVSPWTSGVQFPPVRQLWGGPLGATVVAARGYVEGYSVTTDRLERLGRTRAGQAVARRDAALIADTATREVALFGAERPWKVVAEGRPLWADWAEGERLAVLTRRDDESTHLTLYKPPLTTVLRRIAIDATGDPVITAWGALAYVPGRDRSGAPALIALRVADLSQAAAVSLPSEVRAVVATPSGHRLYAAGTDGQVYVVDRVRGAVVRTLELSGTAERLRFSSTGEILFAKPVGVDSVAVVYAGVDRLAGVLAAGWDSNLPWASPGGRYVVVRSADRLQVFEGPELRLVAEASGAADYLWWPLAWVPRERLPTAEPEPERRSQESRGSEPVQAPEPTQASEPAPPADPSAPTPAPATAGEESTLIPGIYAVVSAARTPDGIQTLRAQLAEEGYPASVDRYVDEFGTVWYRALIGPYRDRSAAEAAAGRVAAVRGVRPWVLELRPSAPTDLR